jgi:DNA/RNA endonuclease YhcR with UshA esterase domain
MAAALEDNQRVTRSFLKARRDQVIKRGILAAIAAGPVALVGITPTSAHHSFAAAYDTSESITITGKIVEVRLTNPHSWFFLDVAADDGTVERWAFEAGTPSGMIRNGYSPKVIKAGDEVTITGFHARDEAQNAGMLRQLVTSDGTVYGMFGPQEAPGAR